MKVKTNELEGELLNQAVAKSEGIELESGYGVQETSGYYNRLLVDGHMSKGQSMLVRYIPSTDWAQGGPIIEREKINIEFDPDVPQCFASYDRGEVVCGYSGLTPLIAAMRCYVASKLGDEVELPEEIKQ